MGWFLALHAEATTQAMAVKRVNVFCSHGNDLQLSRYYGSYGCHVGLLMHAWD